MFNSGDREIGIDINANDAGASETIKKVGGAIGTLDDASAKTSSRFGALGSMMTGVFMGVGMAVANVAGNVIHDVVGMATGAVASAAAMQVANAKLEQAFQLTGSSYAKNAAAIADLSAKGIALGFTDEAIVDSMARLVTATGSTTEAARAMAVAQDLARFKGVSLAEATSALTMIEGGRFLGLARLGIILKDGATVQEALTAVEAKAAGQKEKFAATETGAWAKVSASWDSASSQLASALLPRLTDLANFLATNMVPWIEAFGRGWDKATTAIKFVIEPLAFVARTVQNVVDGLTGSGRVVDDTGKGFNGLGVSVQRAGGTLMQYSSVAAAAAPIIGAFGDASLAAGVATGAARTNVSAFADASLAAGVAAKASGADVYSYAGTWTTAASRIIAGGIDIARAYVNVTQASKLWIADFRLDMAATAPALNTVKTDFNSMLDTLGIGPERAKLQGELVGAKLAAGLKTGTVASRAAGAEMVQTLTDQLNGLDKPMSAAAQKAELAGELVTLEHARGIAKAAGDPTRMALIDTMIGSVKQKMLDLAGLSYTYGFNTGGSWTGGLVASIQRANPQIAGAIAHVTGLFRASSPPGPESPLHNIDQWGFNTGQSWMDRLAGALGNTSGITSAMSRLAPAFAGTFGGATFAGATFGGAVSQSVPGIAAGLGSASRIAASDSGGGSGGLTIINNNVSYSPRPMLSTGSPAEMAEASTLLGRLAVEELARRRIIARPGGTL